MAETRTALEIADAARDQLEQCIESTLRNMAPFAGRIDCLDCFGQGVIVERRQSWRGTRCTLEAHIRRCKCVDIVGELRRRVKELG
jgi:hypothetical protein